MTRTTIGFLGGTGDLGQALAIRLVGSYDEVLLGSREKSKAEEVVERLVRERSRDSTFKKRVRSATDQEVVEKSDIVFATLPAEHAVEEVKELAGHFRGNQLLISTAAPTPKLGKDYVPALVDKSQKGEVEGASPRPAFSNSIARHIKEQVVQDSIEVAAAFQTVPAGALRSTERIEADVPISCDKRETYEKTADIVKKIPELRPVYLGTLEVSGTLEALTSVLLNVGEHNSIENPTLRFVGTGSGK